IHVTEDGTVDVGGHAGFITEGEGVGAAFSFEGYPGDFYVCADGLLGISGVYEAADFNFTATENSGTFRSEEHTSELQSRENLVCSSTLSPYTTLFRSIHVTEDGTVDVGGHAGFITEGEGVGAAFSFEGYPGDFYVCADGLLGISGVYEAADFNFTATENSGTF